MPHTHIENFPSSFSVKRGIPNDDSLSAEDIQTLARIEAECFAPGMNYPEEEYVEYTKQYNLLLTRENEKKQIQGALFYQEDSNTIYINNVIVAAAAQRNGIGKALLKELMEFAVHENKSLTLESPPRNQNYYEKFGFKVVRTRIKSNWTAIDTNEGKNTHYPIRILPMVADVATIQKVLEKTYIAPKVKIIPVDPSENLNQKEIIESIIALTRFAEEQTSFCYSLFFRSKEKEASFRNLRGELLIQLSDIKQKTPLTMETLSSMILAVIRNAMIVRGYGTGSTTSGRAILDVLSNKIVSPFFTENQLNILRNLLQQQGIEPKNGGYIYEEIRKRLFADNDFKSTADKSPYFYYDAPKG